MSLLQRLRGWLWSAVRTPIRAALTLAVGILLGVAAWYGGRIYLYQRHYSSAQAALAGYNFPEARRHLGSCLWAWPNDPPALLLAAQAARRDGLRDEAQSYLDRHREAVPGTSPERALQGVMLDVQRGRVKDHVHALLEYVEVRHPDSEQILEALAQGCIHIYRLDEASFWIKQLLKRHPDNAVGRLLDFQTYETMRKPELALELARKLVVDHPHYDKARLALAGLLFKRHEYEDAVTHYRELHRRQPAQLMPLLGLSRCLLTLGQTDEAEPLLRKLEANHGENADALLECARFALRQKRLADAETLLRRALALAPNDHEVHQEMAITLGQLDRLDESKQHFARYKQIHGDLVALDKVFIAMVKAPTDANLRLEAGRICLRNGQTGEGLRWLSGALALDPRHKATHEALAEYYQSVGDKANAEYHRVRAR